MRMRIFALLMTAAVLVMPVTATPAFAQSSVQGVGGSPATRAPVTPGNSEAALAKIQSAIAELQACNEQLQDLLASRPEKPGASANAAAKQKYEKAHAQWQQAVKKAEECVNRAEAKVQAAQQAQTAAQARDARVSKAQREMANEKRTLNNTVRAIKAK